MFLLRQRDFNFFNWFKGTESKLVSLTPFRRRFSRLFKSLKSPASNSFVISFPLTLRFFRFFKPFNKKKIILKTNMKVEIR